MTFIYTLIIHIFGGLMSFFGLFNHKASLWVRGRKGWEASLLKQINPKEKWIWFHCSSNGEFEDCHELFELVKKDNPNKKTILTFFSPTGYESHGHTGVADVVTFLPLDTPYNAKRFMEIVNPEVAVFSRSEFWYHFLNQLKKKNTPTYLLSFSLSSKSNFLKWPGKLFFQKSLSVFDYIFCQNERTQKLLHENFDIKNAGISGNTRFDRIYQASLNPKRFPGIENFATGEFMIVVGSSLDKDENLILSAMEALKETTIKCMLVPHEIEGPHLDDLVAKNPKEIIRYSNIQNITPQHRILIIDFVGGLKHMFDYASLAVIGGGFDTIGIHNIIEPSVYGVPTTFGPNHRDYPEALDLLQLGGSKIHHNLEELLALIITQYKNPEDKVLKKKIKEYVVSNTGATEKTLAVIRERTNRLI